MGMLTPMPLSLRDVASLWLLYHHPNLSKLNREKKVRKSSTWVKHGWTKASTKSSPLFSLLMVESNTSEVVKPLCPPSQSFLREFEDEFPNDLPLGLLLLLEELSIKLTFSQVHLYPTSRLIGVILMSRKNYKGKSKSCLIVGTLGRVWVLVRFLLFWYLRRMGLSIYMWILGP